MKTNNLFGSRLKYLREAKGISVRELADCAGLNRVHVHQIEAGARKAPTWQTVLKLAEALGVGPESFLKKNQKGD